ncbi:MAG: VIT domain-containing protein [Labilithrix sp.]
MHRKALPYVLLGVTAVCGALGVYKARGETSSSPLGKLPITPVSLVDRSKGVVPAELPVRLTSSDGTGLKLHAMKVDAVVEDPLALTELHLTFENPEDRVLEGTFRITLPQGASLSRFAMKIGDAWQEGEVVEKQAARAAYEDALHRRQDPALMEQGAGNEFSARVFPIPARGSKEIVVTYSEVLEVGASYQVPLKGLPQLGSLDISAHVSGSRAAETGGKTDTLYGLHQTRFTPGGDFIIDAKNISRSPGLRAGDLAITRVIPFASARPEPLGATIVLVDTSASRGLGLAEQAGALTELLAKLPGDTAVTVACFDQDVATVYDGKASGFGENEATAITRRGALGASDFEQAIAWAGNEARKKKASRIVLLTDGVATAGETDAQKLRLGVEKLRDAGVTRMDAVAMGGIRDDAFLRTFVRGVLDRDGVVLDAKLGADAIARRLGEATSSGVEVKVPGARWSWPAQVDGLQAGDEILVYAQLEGKESPLSVSVGGQTFQPDLRTIERPLVERAWAEAKIQSLIDAPKESAAATRAEIIGLSTHYRVLSPYTALLVLESDADYARFNINRTAKGEILTVKDGRIAIADPTTEELRRGEAAKGERAEGTVHDESEEPSQFPWFGRPVSPPTATAQPVPQVYEPAPTAAPPPVAAPPVATPDPIAPSPSSPVVTLAPPAAQERPAAPRPALAPRKPSRAIEPEKRSESDEESRPAKRRGHSNEDDETRKALEELRKAQLESALGDGERDRAQPAPAPSTRRSPRRPRVVETNDDNLAPRTPAITAIVRPTTVSEVNGIDADDVQGVIRGAVPRIRACYVTELSHNAAIRGPLSIVFTIEKGQVRSTQLAAAPGSDTFRGCVSAVARSLRFQGEASGSFAQSFELVSGGGGSLENLPQAAPYEGRFKTVMDALSRGSREVAYQEATRWHAEQPGDILSLVALGEVFEARNELDQAARAYGSILELFSFRADSRRFAGERLERLHTARALALATDSYGKAAAQRADHPASHRLYAYALAKRGDYEKAFEAIRSGVERTYPANRFRGVDRILREDMGLIAAAWMRAQPKRAAEIREKLHAAGGVDENGPSLRFVLVWETDANDVDFHIYDGRGGHAFYSQPHLASGGDLYADVTTGYGPECFTIRGPRAGLAFPYTLQAHYYARGPMGYGMGKLEVIEHDGKGNLTFNERPFVVMTDHAYVDMGSVDKSTKLASL